MAGRGIQRTRSAPASAGAVSEVLEARVFLHERELDGAGRTVALLSHDDFGYAFHLRIRLPVVGAVLLLAEDEHDEVGVLLERAGLAQVGELRPVIGSRLGGA